MFDALRFLTVLPVGRSSRPPQPWSLIAFPLVGALLGVVWWQTGALLGGRFPSAGVPAAAVLLVDALLTGALHYDALADVVDGVASRKSPEEAVAIMRQPAIGAVGAAALVIVCLLRYGALTFSVDFGFRLFAVPVTGRAAMVYLLWRLPPRGDGSLAHAFGRPPTPVVVLTGAVAVICAVPSGPRGLTALVAGIAFTGVYELWWRRRFGGLTGDGVGAGGLLAETLALLVLSSR